MEDRWPSEIDEDERIAAGPTRRPEARPGHGRLPGQIGQRGRTAPRWPCRHRASSPSLPTRSARPLRRWLNCSCPCSFGQLPRS